MIKLKEIPGLRFDEASCEELIRQGFKQKWLDVSNEEIKVEVLAGSGLGNPWLTIEVEFQDGKRRYFKANMGEFAASVAAHLLGEDDYELEVSGEGD